MRAGLAAARPRRNARGPTPWRNFPGRRYTGKRPVQRGSDHASCATTAVPVHFHHLARIGLVRIRQSDRAKLVSNVGKAPSSRSSRGNLGIYTELAERARQEALRPDGATTHAHVGIRDAVVGLSYDANEIMEGITEVLAYGTAVKATRALTPAVRRRPFHRVLDPGGKVRAPQTTGWKWSMEVDGLTTQAALLQAADLRVLPQGVAPVRPGSGEFCAVEIRMEYVGDPPWLDLDQPGQRRYWTPSSGLRLPRRRPGGQHWSSRPSRRARPDPVSAVGAAWGDGSEAAFQRDEEGGANDQNCSRPAIGAS